MKFNFKGAHVAITTPMNGREVDFSAYERHVHFLTEQGIDGIVVCGTTGESPSLTEKERALLIEKTLRLADGKIPVIAGTGTNDTASSVTLSKQAASLGADALLLVTPYYNKPNQEGLLHHFMTIADAVALPQIVYNVPSRTAARVDIKTLAELSRHPNIIGTKDATGDMVFATETLTQCAEGFLLLSGDDGTTLPLMLLGGHGTISVVANVKPRWMHDLCEYASRGEALKALEIHNAMIPLFRALFGETNPIPVKAMLSMLFPDYKNELRSPLLPMTGKKMDAFRDAVGRYL